MGYIIIAIPVLGIARYLIGKLHDKWIDGLNDTWRLMK